MGFSLIKDPFFKMVILRAIMKEQMFISLPVVLHKAVAEVSE